MQATSQLLRLLADPNRVRLLSLLQTEELTVAELSTITQLPQPRVSTHLAKLREANLVRDRRAGVRSYYVLVADTEDAEFDQLWRTIGQTVDDAMLQRDAMRLPEVLAARAQEQNWADSVAGDMERHYSPGRTWEATTRALIELLELGDALDVASGDGVLAELLAPRAKSVTCIDLSEKVIEACRRRLKPYRNIKVKQGDMHDLPFANQSFDVVLLMQALTYTQQAGKAIGEAARVLRPGGRLIATTLNRHRHKSAIKPYDHQTMGFTKTQLKKYCTSAGMTVITADVTSRETRAPNFEVITLAAAKP